MARKILGVFLMLFWLSSALPCFASDFSGDNSTFDDSSVTIDLGEGNGAVIITGSNNTIYIPDPSAGAEKCEIVKATRLSNGFVLILPKTEIQDGSVKVAFKRIILFISDDGVTSVVHAEQ